MSDYEDIWEATPERESRPNSRQIKNSFPEIKFIIFQKNRTYLKKKKKGI